MREDQASDFTLADYRALSEFRFQIRRFLRFSEDQARLHGVEPRQHQLLLAIRGIPAGHKTTVSELAGRLLIRHHSAVELINRLADHGLVKRQHGDSDHREVIVSLTRSGSAVLRKLTEAHREELETLGPKLASTLRSVSRRGRTRRENAA
ncbi:MAG TPA: MarR family transcriptional regulator [Bryobacteraceae bacterium]|nr:MarR family transcriptional regulator [Bryobacteraceae bacterium]